MVGDAEDGLVGERSAAAAAAVDAAGLLVIVVVVVVRGEVYPWWQ
jgi:hypothetical protein